MSITDELRWWINGNTIIHVTELRAIADGIDERIEREYVKLPVDEDGVPIHVGDYVETLIEAFKGERGRVEFLTLTEDGWEVDGDAPSTVRHAQNDSYERILDDAMKLARGNNNAVMKLVERCRRLDSSISR